MILYTFYILLTVIIILSTIILIYSPGKPKQFLDKNGKIVPGSISEKTFVSIGGVKQGMFIRSMNQDNPVLLYLHGGPAFPNYFLVEKYNPGLEKFFTVCYWEQRGGGLSYSPEVKNSSMKFSQLTADALEVTNYLRKRFNKEKIYILAHSGGTPIALKAVAEQPELFHAYIAMAQITNQAESERLALDYMLNRAKGSGDKRLLEKIQQLRKDAENEGILAFFRSPARDKYMHLMGIGTMRKMKSVAKGVFFPAWMCKAYTVKEKFNTWKAKLTFVPKTSIFKEVIETDFSSQIKELKVPVYFFSGKYDYTVNSSLSRDYFNKLNAPLKGFYTFHSSAHSPLFEEPNLTMKIIESDVLRGKNTLSDDY